MILEVAICAGAFFGILALGAIAAAIDYTFFGRG
jgi:hypothetical protein